MGWKEHAYTYKINTKQKKQADARWLGLEPNAFLSHP